MSIARRPPVRRRSAESPPTPSRFTAASASHLGKHQAHLYFKRGHRRRALLGNAEQHRDRVAAMVLDTAAADGALRVADGLPV